MKNRQQSNKQRNIVIVLALILFVSIGTAVSLTNNAENLFRSDQSMIPAKFVGENFGRMDPMDLQMGDYSIEKEISYLNLQLFMIRSDNSLGDKKYIVLEDALKNKQAVVHETSNVSQLSIENKSDDFIFVHYGDIVKGGKQDRTVRNDMIIGPRSHEYELASFCVEQGRWAARTESSVDKFDQTKEMLPSVSLKIEAKHKKRQSELWSKVEKNQEKINKSLSDNYESDYDVRDELSASSLQLSLEDEKLSEFELEYWSAIEKILADDEYSGFIYAINGKFYGMDVYNNNKLFDDLKEKLIKAVIVEAISENTDLSSTKLSVDEIGYYLAIIGQTDEQTEDRINKYTLARNASYKPEGFYYSETIDLSVDSTWIHKNVLRDIEEVSASIQKVRSK